MIEISRIQAWAFRSPSKQPVATSFGIMHDRPAALVRVEAKDGVFGWGEIWTNWPAAGTEHRIRLLEMDIVHLVLGRQCAKPDDLFHALDSQTRIRAIQCGEPGPFAQVIAGLDMAIWDLFARRADLPLRKYINPNAVDVVPVYASGIQVAAAGKLIPEARLSGHKRFKLKVGFDMAGDIAAVHEIYANLNPGEKIACDANQAWSLDQAKEFANALRGIPIEWLEEPLPVFSPPDKWRQLAEYCQIPLSGGENFGDRAAFNSATSSGHLSILQPDIAKWGGLTGCLGVAQQAIAAGRRYFPHFLGAGVGLIASAELLAAVGGDGWLEVDVNKNPLRTLFFDGGKEPISNGDWHCFDEAGIGYANLSKELKRFEVHYFETG